MKASFRDGEHALVESSREQIEQNSNYVDLWKLKLAENQPGLRARHALGRLPGLQSVEPRRQPGWEADRLPVGAQQRDPAGVGSGIFVLNLK